MKLVDLSQPLNQEVSFWPYAPEIQNRRLPVGCFPWKFKGGEAAFSRVVAFLE